MILVVGNNITSLVLSTYFEQNHIQYKRIFTKNIKDFIFYADDSMDGMQKLAMDKIACRLPIVAEKSFGIRTSSQEYILDNDIGQMSKEILKFEKKDNVEKFETIFTQLGREWNQIIENDFTLIMSQSKYMARNFMKSYRQFLEVFLESEEAKRIWMSFVPRTDIALNTAAGYIVNQVFGKSSHVNQLSTLYKYMLGIVQKSNQIKIDNFDELHIDKEKKHVEWASGSMKYDTVINTVSKKEAEVYLMMFYVTCDLKENGHIFYALDDMQEMGINQMILWSYQGKCQLDIYYKNVIDENQIEKYVRTRLPYAEIQKRIGFEELKDQYGCGDFAGWALSCKENLKNPMQCSNVEYIDLSGWGNAHFTSALLAISALEKRSKEYG